MHMDVSLCAGRQMYKRVCVLVYACKQMQSVMGKARVCVKRVCRAGQVLVGVFALVWLSVALCQTRRPRERLRCAMRVRQVNR